MLVTPNKCREFKQKERERKNNRKKEIMNERKKQNRNRGKENEKEKKELSMKGGSCPLAQCLSKRGVAIAYIGGSSSVLAVAGYGAAGNAVIWDTLAPVSSGPICSFTHHSPLVTAMQVWHQAASCNSHYSANPVLNSIISV